MKWIDTHKFRILKRAHQRVKSRMNRHTRPSRPGVDGFRLLPSLAVRYWLNSGRAHPKPCVGSRKKARATFLDRVIGLFILWAELGVIFDLVPLCVFGIGGAGRRQHDFVREIDDQRKRYQYVVLGDITKFFDSVPYEAVMDQVRAAGVNPRAVGWLMVFYRMQQPTYPGLTRACAASPLLCSYCIRSVDLWAMRIACWYGRFGDDFAAFFDTEDEARAFAEELPQRLAALGLSVHVDADDPKRLRVVETSESFTITKMEFNASGIHPSVRTCRKFLGKLGKKGKEPHEQLAAWRRFYEGLCPDSPRIEETSLAALAVIQTRTASCPTTRGQQPPAASQPTNIKGKLCTGAVKGQLPSRNPLQGTLPLKGQSSPYCGGGTSACGAGRWLCSLSNSAGSVASRPPLDPSLLLNDPVQFPVLAEGEFWADLWRDPQSPLRWVEVLAELKNQGVLAATCRSRLGVDLASVVRAMEVIDVAYSFFGKGGMPAKWVADAPSLTKAEEARAIARVPLPLLRYLSTIHTRLWWFRLQVALVFGLLDDGDCTVQAARASFGSSLQRAGQVHRRGGLRPRDFVRWRVRLLNGGYCTHGMRHAGLKPVPLKKTRRCTPTLTSASP